MWFGLALVTLAFLHKIAIEEHFFLAQFGATYQHYRALPPIPSP